MVLKNIVESAFWKIEISLPKRKGERERHWEMY